MNIRDNELSFDQSKQIDECPQWNNGCNDKIQSTFKIKLTRRPCNLNILEQLNSSSYIQSQSTNSQSATAQSIGLENLNITDLMNLTDPMSMQHQREPLTNHSNRIDDRFNNFDNDIHAIRNIIPQLSLNNQLRMATLKCKGLSKLRSPENGNNKPTNHDHQSNRMKTDWSSICPDGDWLSFKQDMLYPSQPTVTESICDHNWKPFLKDHLIVLKSAAAQTESGEQWKDITLNDDIEKKDSDYNDGIAREDRSSADTEVVSTTKCMKELSRKVKRILVPHLRHRNDLEKLTGVFVDSRLHTLIAQKINEIVQSTDDVEGLGAEYISKKIVDDNQVKAELDSLCPMIAKMIFSSKQFRQLQVRIQRPTIRDHLERPETVKIHRLMMASKRYYQRELNGFLRTPTEDQAIGMNPVTIKPKETVNAVTSSDIDSCRIASDSEITNLRKRSNNDQRFQSLNTNDVRGISMSDDQYRTNDTPLRFSPPENVTFKVTALKPKNERGSRSNKVFPLDANAEPFFPCPISSATIMCCSNNNDGIGQKYSKVRKDREPPDIPTKRILFELDRTMDQRP